MCNYTRPQVFWKVCGLEDAENKAREFVKSVDLGIDTPQDYLRRVYIKDERPIEEQLELLEQCRACPRFRRTYCANDKGCDRRKMFLIRLAKRWCDNWGEKP